jgi:arabinan endo-1,5-alpha-L-arabinosidase
MRVLPAFLTLTFAALARAVVGPAPVTGNTAVHDPTMCKDSSGKYWIFCKTLALS